MIITPAQARIWLKKNLNNRHLREVRVIELIAIIKGKRWIYDGNPIRFSKDGILLDGQHRLEAIARSGISAESAVVTGLDPDAQQSIDTGAPRSAADILRMRGYSGHAHRAAAVARILLAFDSLTMPGSLLRIPFYQIEQTVSEYSAALPWVFEAIGDRLEPGISSRGAPVQAAFAWLWYVDPVKVSELARQVKTGEGATRGTHAALIRTVIGRAEKGRQARDELTLRVLKGVDAYLHNTPIRSLRRIDIEVLEDIQERRSFCLNKKK